MKNVIQVVLAIVIIALAYLLYESIQTPIRFEKEKEYRYDLTIERLKEIRTCQVAFKSENNRYTGSFDTLIDFIKTGSFEVTKQIGSFDDSAAVARGEVYRETIKVTVKDSLFDENFDINLLRFVPGTKTEFELGATILEISKVKVPVFEAKAHNDVILQGLNENLIFNLNEKSRINEKYAGMKVGSLTEANNNAGNWE